MSTPETPPPAPSPSDDHQASSFGSPRPFQTRRISLFPPFSDSRLCKTHTPPCTDPKTGEVVSHHYPSRDISVGEAVRIIQGDVHREATDAIRRHDPDSAAYARAKRSLWSMSPACTATMRSNDSVAEFSGLVPLDFDGAKDAGGMAKTISEHPAVVLVKRSPGGSGLHVWVAVDPLPTPETYRACYEEVFQAFTHAFGPGFTKTDHLPSPVALQFVAHDLVVIFNQRAIPLLWTPPDPDAQSREDSQTRGPRGPSPQQWLEKLPHLQRVGQQLQGACPACGQGRDRFHVNLAPPHLYQCRVCDTNGDSTAPYRAVFGNQSSLLEPPEWPEWAEWTPVAGRPPPQPPFPLETFALRELVEAAVTLTGGASVPTTVGCLLGAVSAAAQGDYKCQSLARGYIPPCIFTVCISESGWRKSTAASIFWAVHDQADSAVAAAWTRACAAYDAMKSEERDSLSAPTLARPTLIKKDATVEALIASLEKGRPCQASYSDEAGAQVLNWSGSGAHLARTFAILSALWDGSTITLTRTSDKGKDIRLSAYAVTLTWLSQARVMDPVVMGLESADGFCARTLLCRDDARPARAAFMPTNEAEAVIERYDHIIKAVRERQDRQMQVKDKEDPWRPRGRVRLTDAAQSRLSAFNALQETASDELHFKGAIHERAFAVRAAEQAARLASLFTIWREYVSTGGKREPAPDLLVTDEDMASALATIRWYQEELNRIASQAEMTEAARLANRVEDRIVAEYEKESSKRVNREGLILLNSLIQQDVLSLKNDPDKRDLVIGRLVQEGHIRPVSRGRFAVHPHLRRLSDEKAI